MTLEERVTNLELLVNGLSKLIANDKMYTDADIEGCRASISEVKPIFSETKNAYIDETEIIFWDVPSGKISVAFSIPSIEYSAVREDSKVIVTFSPLVEMTEVTLSIF